MSISVLTLTPPAPAISVHSTTPDGQMVIKLEGQVDVPYVVQTSINLTSWASVSTNTLTSPTLLLTNATTSVARKFWRAAWLP